MSKDAEMWDTLNCLPDAVEHMIHGDPDEPGSVKASDAVRWAIAEIVKLREERRWVPVGERLPDDLRRVMVMAPGLYGAQVAWILNGKWHDGIGYPDDAIDGRVTHWQPLPPGPEGDG